MNKILLLLIFTEFIFPHGVSKSTVDAMADASLLDYLWFGAEHMVTGYDHILFLIGVLFFLTNYLDIFKFITAFTIAHCITLIFATFFGITANAYLIDAVIAFSVIYKGFENLDGFKKWFSINAPNLIVMVFIFGLIHGFGLSTKLQEIAMEHDINLSLSQILSFNVGVELGQIAVLLIVFPLLSMSRGKSFNTISKLSNWMLVIAGIFLLFHQLNGFFINDEHHHEILAPDLQESQHQHSHDDNHKHHHDH
ncbi:MAG: hypothetical protein CMG64_01535 [Candidatus Marinimicrobia bacterium]|nr:hypothetical protein [Candidatus Neomarinimicrobiota bacterium]|tara:strand:+ start:527 stop:1282 length:756 start_codon:yes stop_codon:yes gene_type:complete